MRVCIYAFIERMFMCAARIDRIVTVGKCWLWLRQGIQSGICFIELWSRLQAKINCISWENAIIIIIVVISSLLRFFFFLRHPHHSTSIFTFFLFFFCEFFRNILLLFLFEPYLQNQRHPFWWTIHHLHEYTQTYIFNARQAKTIFIFIKIILRTWINSFDINIDQSFTFFSLSL